MSRIRSIHPGFAKDENFIEVSRDARLFFLLLLTECDDFGVFVWKPKTLKMQLFPADDDVDVTALMAELVRIDAIRSYEIDGRKLGAVRNFRKFQKPKFPKSAYPITPDIGSYTASTLSITEIDDDQEPPIPRNGENASPIGEGDGDGEGVGEGEERKHTYAGFSGRVIRLTGADYDRWQASFPNLNGTLRGELESRDAWLATQPPADRKKWFQSTAAFLAKRNREAAQARAAPLAGRAAI